MHSIVIKAGDLVQIAFIKAAQLTITHLGRMGPPQYTATQIVQEMKESRRVQKSKPAVPQTKSQPG